MIQKIKQWLKRHKRMSFPVPYTLKQLENSYKLGYTDGKRDGLTVAREQATKSLKEILWAQNQTK